MSDNYKSRRAFSDALLPQIKCLLGMNMIQDASLLEDTRQATDLIMPAMRLAVRVRKAKWMERFGNEFTVRNYAPGGLKTEYEKLQELGDLGPSHMLYCFANDDGKILKAWLIDVELWKIALKSGAVKASTFRNVDGTINLTFPCHSDFSSLLSVD